MRRRMFSQQIIDSDAFLDMSTAAQALYFHLGMRADDDGFVGNPKKIMRMIGANEDDLKILIVKRFILVFKNGVVVIKHWKIHNYIQNDRYRETVYLDEKKQLKLKENGSYTECIQNGYKMDTQVKLSKVKLSKVKLVATADAVDDQLNKYIGLFIEINPTINFGNTTTRSATKELLNKFGGEKLTEIITFAISVQGKQFAPVITTPYQLKEKLAQLMIYYQKENNKPLTSKNYD